MGEHVSPKVSLCKPDAFSTFSARTELSEGGEIKIVGAVCGADQTPAVAVVYSKDVYKEKITR